MSTTHRARLRADLKRRRKFDRVLSFYISYTGLDLVRRK